MSVRRRLLQCLPAAAALASSGTAAWRAAAQPGAGAARKVLRLASESETGFDPARVGDVRSLLVAAHILGIVVSDG